MQKQEFKNISLNQIFNYCEENNQPKFRAKQIVEWIYGRKVEDFSLMTNLPKSFINKLSADFVISSLEMITSLKSTDGTRKYIFKVFNDNNSQYIETVGIPSNDYSKLTICVSSQVGCAMQCKFCATGKQGFTRNLSIGEIVDQIILVQEDFGVKATNIVFMGQGEPFLNYDNLIDALEIINNPKCLNIGARKITISSCGIIPGIKKFASINKQYELAVSLHSAIQQKRNQLMPGVKKYKLDELKNTLESYCLKTNRRITLEYIMLKDINDNDEDLNALIDFCKNIHCYINIIKFNAVDDTEYAPSSTLTINSWITKLEHNNIAAGLRNSKGSDIDAACGQLISKLV